MAVELEHFGTQFAREGRRLSQALDERARDIDVGLLRRLAEDVILAEEPEAICERLLSEKGGAPDPVGQPTRFAVSPATIQQRIAAEAELRGFNFEERIRCWRWELAFDWQGAPDLFGHWPDETDPDLEVFDNHSQLGHPPTIKWRGANGRLVADCYTLRTTDAEDENALRRAWEMEQTAFPDDLFDRAIRYAKSYCEAANSQIDAWVDRLRHALVDEIRRRRRLLELGEMGRRRANKLLDEWRVPELEFVAPALPAKTTTETSAPQQPPEFLPILTDASHEAILLVANRWIDAVERYSAAFVDLEEERVADLLTASLNGAFARADREVFIGSGKSDFYVTSQTLGIDGLPDAFAGELKNWDGQKSLLDAVGQSLNNLTQRTRNALLVILVKDRKSFLEAVKAGIDALGGDQRIVTRLQNLAGRPLFHARSALDPEATVQLSVSFVDLTRPEELAPKPKGHRSRRGAKR